ncbi:MAG: hypothetical protein DDG60_11760 [Anaerolineae bacterium]|nr:MAG: hypothetical protein DDG60_11760 [Anaerolineae bacterium]
MKRAQENPFELSIMILTRNRKNEVLRAIQSCVECCLPEKTEFVIVDNASEDGTQQDVERFLLSHSCTWQYHYLPENIGCAAGRNVGLRISRGRFVFFLDDDAYIEGPKESFFQDMIRVMRQHDDIFCITTSLFDTKLNHARPFAPSRFHHSGEFYRVLMFHGGSSMIDKEKWLDPNRLFFDYQFRGMAELYPTLKGYFHGRYVVEMPSVRVIHDPSPNAFFSQRMQILYHYSGAVHVKLTFYPGITHPIVYGMFVLRIWKYLGRKGVSEAFEKLSNINKNLAPETVSLKQFLRLLSEFGLVNVF